MFTTILRQLVDSPKRMWIVTTVTFLFGLVVTWPMVDKYHAAIKERNTLESTLSETREMASRLSQFEETVSRQLNLVSTLDKEAMSPDKVQLFRNRVVHLVRQSGCKMRRIQLAEPLSRDWCVDDNVIRGRRSSDSDPDPTPFRLRSWKFTVIVTGPMPSVSRLLEELSNERQLMNSTRFSLQRAEGDAKSAVVELEVDLFELVKKSPEEAA